MADSPVLKEILETVKANAQALRRLHADTPRKGASEASCSPNKPTVVTRGLFTRITPELLQFFEQAAQLGCLTVQTDFISEENVYLLRSIKYVNRVEIVYDGSANPLQTTIEHLDAGDVVFVHPEAASEELKELCITKAVKCCVATGDAVFPATATGLGAVSTASKTATDSQVAAVPPALPGFTATADPADVDDLNAFPWRVCLAGGWLDQPWVSSICPGSVIVVNIRPHPMFKVRSGLATSTRQAGIRLWGRGLKPPKDTPPLALARMLFGAENPPGVQYISGSQDALGLMLPGINRLDYEGGFWPAKVTTVKTDEPAKWLQKMLWLVPLASRPAGYDPIAIKNLTPENVKLLADASARAWEAICNQDAPELGAALLDTMKAWKAILPNTVPAATKEWCAPYEDTHGYLFSGAGGGFLMVISDTPVKNGFQVSINTIPWAKTPFQHRSVM